MGNDLKRNEIFLASTITLVGAILFSTKAIFVKLAYQFEVDHLSLLLLRMLFSLPFYIVIFVIFNRNTKFEKLNIRHLIWIAGFGIFGYYLASLFDFKGLQYIPAGVERVILFLYPTMVLIFSKFIFGIKIQRVQILAILISYLGVIIAFAGQGNSIRGDNYFLGGFFVLLSSITYASYLVGCGWLLPKIGTFRFTSLAMIFATLYLIVHYLAINQQVSQLFNFPKEVYVYGILMAVFSTVIPSFLISEGIKRIGANNASIIGGVGPISTIVLAYIFLGESFTFLQFMGTLMVILGVLIISLKGK